MDFETVDGGTYSIPGEGSYRLNDLLPFIIGKEGDVSDASLELIEGEDVAGALYLTQDENKDWVINSDVAFTSTYLLTITVDGVKYEVKVTDAVKQDYTDLSQLASTIDVNVEGGNSVDGTTSESTLFTKLSYAITNEPELRRLRQAAEDNSTTIKLDYDLSSYMDAHDSWTGLSGNGTLYDTAGIEIGSFAVENGHVLLDINPAKVATNVHELGGDFELQIQIDGSNVNDEGTETYEFPGTSDTINIHWPGKEHGAGTKNVNRTGDEVNTGEDGSEYLEYVYTLTIDGGTNLSELNLSDALPSGMELYGGISAVRKTTTYSQTSTREAALTDSGNWYFGAWSAWNTTQSSYVESNPTPVTASGSTGTITADVLAAFGLDSADSISAISYTSYAQSHEGEADYGTARTRTYTQSVYELTYTARIQKQTVLNQIAASGGTSVSLKNTATWNPGEDEIPGGDSTVTITKKEPVEGKKAATNADGNGKVSVAYIDDTVVIDNVRYALVDYTITISEPYNAATAVLTDVLSEYQKLANGGAAELWINYQKAKDIHLRTEGSNSSTGNGGTITYELHTDLESLGQNFTANTIYQIKYSTLVATEDIGQNITNESSWTINNKEVPGEDETVVVERKPYEQGRKQDKLISNHVTGDGGWEIPWEITTLQHQSANVVNLHDEFSADQTLKKDSFSVWIGGVEYPVSSDVLGNYLKNETSTGFDIDFSGLLKYLLNDSSDPVFKAETEYKLTYTTTTDQYDIPNNGITEKSHNESTWTFDTVSDNPSPDDVILEKDNYKSGVKMEQSSEGTGTGNWTTEEEASVEYITIAADDNKIDLSYKITLNEPMAVTQALLTDHYSSFETVDVSSMKINGVDVSSYVTDNAGSHTFTIDYVRAIREALGEAFRADKDYVLTYDTYIPLTDGTNGTPDIKSLLKEKDANDQIKGLTVTNQQIWSFKGPNGDEEVPGNETEYTFKEKPYNGGDKEVAVYDAVYNELMDDSRTDNSKYSDFDGTHDGNDNKSGIVITNVDQEDNILKYTITLTEHRNSNKVVLKDNYSSNQTLNTGSFTVTFSDNEGEHEISGTPGLTPGTNSFEFDLTRALNAAGFTFTPEIEYVIEYTATTSTVGNTTGGAGTNPDGHTIAGDGQDNEATWEFDDGDGEEDGGITEVHLEIPDYLPGTKTVNVREKVGTTTVPNAWDDTRQSDWHTWDSEKYPDRNFIISNVMEDGPYHLDYTITIYEERRVDTAVVTDTFRGSVVQTLDTGSFYLQIEDGDPIAIPSSYIKVTDSDPKKGFTFDLTTFLGNQNPVLRFEKNTHYYITFTTTTETKGNINGSGDGQDNKADWVLNEENVDGGHTETHINKVPTVRKDYYNITEDENNNVAGGEVTFEDRLKYVITIGDAGDDLHGYYLEDNMENLQHIDTSKGIIVEDAEGTQIADLTSGQASNGWQWGINPQQGWNTQKTRIFWLKFPDANAYTGDLKGPVTITYYVDVTNETDYISAVGHTGHTVENTVKTNESEITTDYDLDVGTITLEKTANEIDADKIGANNVSANWSITVTPSGTTLNGTKIVDLPARFSTVDSEHAINGTGTTEMWVESSTVTVTWKNTENGHTAGDPVDSNLWSATRTWNAGLNTNVDTISFTGNITDAVVVNFDTKATSGYTKGAIYFYNQAVLQDGGDNNITDPDDATNEYTTEGEITATKTMDSYDVKTGEVNWVVTVNKSGSVSLKDQYVAESLYAWSQTQLEGSAWSNYPAVGMAFDTNNWDGLVIADANNNILIKGTDYTTGWINEANKSGIRFLKNLDTPLTITIPMS